MEVLESCLDSEGKTLGAYDDVAMVKSCVFRREEHKSETASLIHLQVMPVGSEATVTGITRHKRGNDEFVVLDLEAVEGVFFSHELSENVRLVRTSEEKLNA